MAALESGLFRGGWVDRPKGGYFYLDKVNRNTSPVSMIEDKKERDEEADVVRRVEEIHV